VITTKSGKKSKGLGVFQSPLIYDKWSVKTTPEIQGVYGAGSKQTYDLGADTNLGPRFDSGIYYNGSPGYSIEQGQVLPFNLDTT
jgi:hypothetical protein